MEPNAKFSVIKIPWLGLFEVEEKLNNPNRHLDLVVPALRVQKWNKEEFIVRKVSRKVLRSDLKYSFPKV